MQIKLLYFHLTFPSPFISPAAPSPRPPAASLRWIDGIFLQASDEWSQGLEILDRLSHKDHVLALKNDISFLKTLQSVRFPFCRFYPFYFRSNLFWLCFYSGRTQRRWPDLVYHVASFSRPSLLSRTLQCVTSMQHWVSPNIKLHSSYLCLSPAWSVG